jgi:RNase P subunit RPR2
VSALHRKRTQLRTITHRHPVAIVCSAPAHQPCSGSMNTTLHTLYSASLPRAQACYTATNNQLCWRLVLSPLVLIAQMIQNSRIRFSKVIGYSRWSPLVTEYVSAAEVISNQFLATLQHTTQPTQCKHTAPPSAQHTHYSTRFRVLSASTHTIQCAICTAHHTVQQCHLCILHRV